MSALGNAPFDLGNDPLSPSLRVLGDPRDWDWSAEGIYGDWSARGPYRDSDLAGALPVSLLGEKGFSMDTSLSAPTAVLSALGTEYLRALVEAVDPVTGLAEDPTADPVEVAFIVLQSGRPVEDDWIPAQWTTIRRRGRSLHFARVLVGPEMGADIGLSAGFWEMWVRVTDNPAIVVRQVGMVWIQ